MDPATKKKRARGSFAPSPYKIVDVPSGLLFGQRARQSYYLKALQDLAKAPRGKVLAFEKPQARLQISVQARKHKLPVLFAEEGGVLYVRLASDNGPESVVLEFLRGGPQTMADISRHLNTLGMADNHGGVMADLSRNNKVRLESIGAAKKWKLTSPLVV